jgi:hypothetical protein
VHFGLPPDLTWYKLLSDQGSFIGGVFALIAGIAAYVAGRVQANATQQAATMQMETELRKIEQEVDTLRKSLATELRQLVPRALMAHELLKRLSEQKDGPITAWMVESLSRVPDPVIYPGSASKIGLLENDTMDVVIVYNLFDIARASAAQLMRYRTSDNITPMNVAGVAAAFLQVCIYARDILPRFRTGVALHDDRDMELFGRINEAAVSAGNSPPG